MIHIPDDIHAYCHQHDHDDIDDVTPRPLSAEDAALLGRVATEMRTQDTLATAAPRFWVIMDVERIYRVSEDWNGIVFCEDGNPTPVAEDVDELAEWLCEQVTDGVIGGIAVSQDLQGHAVCVTGIVPGGLTVKIDPDDPPEFMNGFSLCDLRETYGIALEAVPYRRVEYIVPDTLFLTQEEAWEHLRANRYHYGLDAHPYCMHVWRAPLTSGVLDVIARTDWNALPVEGDAS